MAIGMQLLSLLMLFSCLEARAEEPEQTEQPDVEQVFQANNRISSLQRKFTISVASKSEDCFYLDVVKGQVFNLHFMVLSAGSSGQQLDISTRIRNDKGRMVSMHSRKKQDQLLGHIVPESGHYEICFGNRYSIRESKKVFWQFELEGALDKIKIEQTMINVSLTSLQEATGRVLDTVKSVRYVFTQAKTHQWWLGSASRRQHSRMQALKGMVDTWSLINAVLMVMVGLSQVYVLRRFFNVKPSPHRINSKI